MRKDKTSRQRRTVRHLRLRRKVRGTAQRPRLTVFRSLNHMYAQVIDDERGDTLAAACSLESQVRQATGATPKTEVSKLVGKLIAQRAKEKGIKAVVFDRGGHKYHGRVMALAEAAREEGLQF